MNSQQWEGYVYIKSWTFHEENFLVSPWMSWFRFDKEKRIISIWNRGKNTLTIRLHRKEKNYDILICHKIHN